MESRKSLPIGNDDFRKLWENGSYYVDKTWMIKDFIKMQDAAALIAPPRRFGKTLNRPAAQMFASLKEELYVEYLRDFRCGEGGSSAAYKTITV